MVEFDVWAYVYYGTTIIAGAVLIFYAWKATKRKRDERVANFKNTHERRDIR